MNVDILYYFRDKPEALPLFEAIHNMIVTEFENARMDVLKTTIAFSNRYRFAYVGLPFRKVKGRPKVCVILTFGLGYKLEHPRIDMAVEPYPRRWTHHVVIQNVDEVDEQIREWIEEAYHFANAKR